MASRAATIVVVIIAVTVAAVLIGPFASAIADATDEQSIDNEEFEAGNDEFVDLDFYNIVEDSETVEYEDGGDWFELGEEDYEMNYDSGEIKIDEESNDVDPGDTLRISYDYVVADGMTSSVLTIAPLFLALLLLFVLANRVMDLM